MKLPVLTLGLAAVGLALPALEQRDGPQTVRLTFYGGPASYSMEFPADGVVRETSKSLFFSSSCSLSSSSSTLFVSRPQQAPITQPASLPTAQPKRNPTLTLKRQRNGRKSHRRTRLLRPIPLHLQDGLGRLLPRHLVPHRHTTASCRAAAAHSRR